MPHPYNIDTYNLLECKKEGGFSVLIVINQDFCITDGIASTNHSNCIIIC